MFPCRWMTGPSCSQNVDVTSSIVPSMILYNHSMTFVNLQNNSIKKNKNALSQNQDSTHRWMVMHGSCLQFNVTLNNVKILGNPNQTGHTSPSKSEFFSIWVDYWGPMLMVMIWMFTEAAPVSVLTPAGVVVNCPSPPVKISQAFSHDMDPKKKKKAHRGRGFTSHQVLWH